MEAARLSWNLGTIEQRVAARLMAEEQEHVRKAVRMLVDEKPAKMHGEVSRILPFRVPVPTPTSSSAPSMRSGVDVTEFRSRMLQNNVLVRDCSSFGGPCCRYSRFCVKTPEKDDELPRGV